MNNTPSSDNITPKRTSSLQQTAANKRSSVSSLLDLTKNATIGRLSLKRTSQHSEQQQQKTIGGGGGGGLQSIYDDEEEDDYTGEPIPKAPRLTSEFFNKYEIITEYVNLSNPNHCPLGVFVTPSSDDLYVWYGVIFVHKGFYRSGAFKFRLTIPQDYPSQAPSVTFLTDMFHPLVDVNGNVSIAQQFPIWRPFQDYIFHILHYLKNMFKKVVLDGLNDKYCFNKEAYRLYRTDISVFGKLAQQCAQLSITESYLFDHFPDNNVIKFAPLSEAKFDELKAQMLNSVANPDPPSLNDD